MPLDRDENRISRWRAYWAGTNSEPLIGYSYGSYFVSRRFPAASGLLREGALIAPDMADAERFFADFDAQYEQRADNCGDCVFSAMPFPGIPWLEAIAGLSIYGGANSFHAAALPNASVEAPVTVRNAAWRSGYLESFDKLAAHSAGRYAVGQPIMRGPGDLIGAMYGAQELIYQMMDNPDAVCERLEESTTLLIDLFKCQRKRAARYMGGYTLGFYEMWCPEFGIYYQDDLLALLSPALYDKFLFGLHCRIAEAFPYSMFHLHPNCLYALDRLLEIDNLTAIEINKDVNGPDISMLMPYFKKTIQKKRLHIWGDISTDELALIRRELNPQGLCITIYSESKKGFEQ